MLSALRTSAVTMGQDATCATCFIVLCIEHQQHLTSVATIQSKLYQYVTRNHIHVCQSGS